MYVYIYLLDVVGGAGVLEPFDTFGLLCVVDGRVV